MTNMSHMGEDLKGDLLVNRQPPDSLRLQNKRRQKLNALIAAPFVFQLCGKEFNRMHNLMGHMHLHSDSKPFKCLYCPSKFTLKGNLTRHMKVKHGVMDRGLDERRKDAPDVNIVDMCTYIFSNKGWLWAVIWPFEKCYFAELDQKPSF